MQGRYGADQFSRFLIYVISVGLLLNIFLNSKILNWVLWALLIYQMYRIFSKNHGARYAENQKYLQLSAKWRYWFGQQKRLFEERKVHRIFVCPKCKQKIRIPKGKGKIMVRCPKCGNEFKRRS